MLRLTAIRSVAMVVALVLGLAGTLHTVNAAFGLAAGPHTHGFGSADHSHQDTGHASSHDNPADNPEHHPLAGLCVAMAGVTLPECWSVSFFEPAVVWDDAPAAVPGILKPKVPDPPPR